MKSITNELEARFQQALERAFGADYAQTDPMIRQVQDTRFGDYQSNLAMGLAKKIGDKPRSVAEKIVANLNIDDICETPEIAGPGFINLRLKSTWLAKQLQQNLSDDRIGIDKIASPQTIVVDYCGPNIAKQMHVGHLRTTIIGDTIARVLEFMGNNVIRQNHIGDWGTQFGMLIAYLFESFGTEAVETGNLHIADIEAFYKQANEKFKSDRGFADRARKQVVELQAGDKMSLRAWEVFRNESLKHCQEIYDLLKISLKMEDVRGESFYNPYLPAVVDDLLNKQHIAVEDQGAICIFLDGFKGKDDSPLPVIIRKSDGGYLYATTDLAALRFRVTELHAHRIIYLTDMRQTLHFQQIIATVHKAGWDIHPITHQPITIDHVTFGSVLGDDGKPLKTRSGENVKLKDLLDEAVVRAKAVVEQKNAELPEDQKKTIAETVGIGAVKYADLSHSRTSDYIFNFDKMLAMEGNTAPYLMYAYARIKSIQRKGQINGNETAAGGKIIIAHPAEAALAKKLLQFSEIIEDVVKNLRPNTITSYLFDLSQTFSGFYENCPVLKAEDDATRASRLLLCELTAKTLKQGLELLGILTVEQM